MKNICLTVLILASLIASLSVNHAEAQQSVELAGTFIHAGDSVPADAAEENKVFLSYLTRFPRREPQWRWVVVVDDSAWRHLLELLGVVPERNHSIYGVTSLPRHTTWIRGYTLLNPDRPEAAPEHVVAHEMAHVYLQSANEDLVDDTAYRWIAQLKSGHVPTHEPQAPAEAVPAVPLSNDVPAAR